jgi:hypothetical protein
MSFDGDFDVKTIVRDFASGLRMADEKRPQAKSYRPGIGPHTEKETIQLVVAALLAVPSSPYNGRVSLEVPYPNSPRAKCDVCLGLSPDWQWVIEIKMLRLMGDNGKPNDNMLMHILSPYPGHRSAVTDCEKLLTSGLRGRKAVVIYGYDYDSWPMDPAIEAFEVLARSRVSLSNPVVAEVSGLAHPVHQRGRVFGWEIAPYPSGAL